MLMVALSFVDNQCSTPINKDMMNPKYGGGRTEVGSHNMIGVAMEDHPEEERITLEKELE
jgi:hypothetical protein